MYRHALDTAMPTKNSNAPEDAAVKEQPLEGGSPPTVFLDNLPRIQSDALEYLNIIYGGDRNITLEWPDGSDCTVALHPEGMPCPTESQNSKQFINHKQQGMVVQEIYRSSGPRHTELEIQARIGPHNISISLSSTGFIELLDGENAALLPPDIKCALLESYLGNAVWKFEQVSGLLINITAITHRPRKSPDRGYDLFFEIYPGGQVSASSGYLSMDLQGLCCLADILKHQGHQLPWNRIDHLRIPVGFVLGSTSLRLSKINTLASDDIILVDGFTTQSNKALPIRIDVAGNPFWLARNTDNRLVVEARLEHTMQNDTKESAQKDEEITDLEDIELELVFELGRKSMSLAQVRRISPGYAFDLACELSNPVSIYINGGCMGKGELVKIDDRLGVRLTQQLQRQETSGR